MKLKNKKFYNYTGKVYDLQVSSKDHSYNIENVVVHNSVCGSLLAYSLSITEIDPIKFDLYFERFLNKERKSFPDIDCDYQQGSRELVREYLENKYGKEAVFGVGSHHLYHPKSALQDVTRGLGLDSSFGSTLMMEVTKLEELEDQKNLREFFDIVLEQPNITSSLRKWILDSEEVIKWADKLLGQCKNIGTHAGGILICPGPIYNYIPVQKSSKEIVTAFREADGSGKDLSELGLLKLDILGLKTLNVINDCIESIKRDLNEDITDKVRYIDLEDVNLFTRFKKGNNVGIFQMDGCLHENSLITLANGTQKKIKDLKIGDKNISYNEKTEKFEVDTIKKHVFTGMKNGFKIIMEDGSHLKTSKDHRFLTNEGWKKAYELKEGDNILSANDGSFGKNHICNKIDNGNNNNKKENQNKIRRKKNN